MRKIKSIFLCIYQNLSDKKNTFLYLLIIGVFVHLILASNKTIAQEDYFGRFIGNIVSEWQSDGRGMKLIRDFSFEDPDGIVWVAPAGVVINGASIPKSLWSLLGSPFSGKHREASVIHDAACRSKDKSWQDVHMAFYYALRTSGISIARAKILYAAVYHFGPRWMLEDTETVATRSINPIQQAPDIDKEEFSKLADQINNSESKNINFSLEDIRNHQF